MAWKSWPGKHGALSHCAQSGSSEVEAGAQLVVSFSIQPGTPSVKPFWELPHRHIQKHPHATLPTP